MATGANNSTSASPLTASEAFALMESKKVSLYADTLSNIWLNIKSQAEQGKTSYDIRMASQIYQDIKTELESKGFTITDHQDPSTIPAGYTTLAMNIKWG